MTTSSKDLAEIYVVTEEYKDAHPIAVRTSINEAFKIAQAYNLANGSYTAVVIGYDTDSVGQGTQYDIPEA
jgi:hypothetical protein